MSSKKTGISMSGSIENAKRPGLILCDCSKCFHKVSPKGGGKAYCNYYKKEIDKNKKRCARYYGEEVKPKNTSRPKETSKASRTCKKCKHYDFQGRFCNSFCMDIFSTSTGKYCKNYDEKSNNIPKKYKYKHNNSKKKWNKYNLRK